ncbi:MAG TPA: cytochrome c biogenesis protein CcdA, partial [Acidimicrobiales bacterium]|nr:cytochrome c biogenesis protein CcdA [Acidimicrobiales bacterium]
MEGLALPVLAVVAGVVSFSSPCCLPLVPGYLSYVSALPVSELDDAGVRRVSMRASLLFVAGFTLVFTVFGVAASIVGSLFLRNQEAIVGVFGVVIVALGLATIGVLRLPLLARERRLDLARVPRGPAWAFPMRMAFAAGWAPCIGPVLATILATAAAPGTVAWGAVLLVLYSLGLGVPFVLIALGFARAQRSLEWLRRNGRHIEVAGGALLVGVGRATAAASGEEGGGQDRQGHDGQGTRVPPKHARHRLRPARGNAAGRCSGEWARRGLTSAASRARRTSVGEAGT